MKGGGGEGGRGSPFGAFYCWRYGVMVVSDIDQCCGACGAVVCAKRLLTPPLGVRRHALNEKKSGKKRLYPPCWDLKAYASKEKKVYKKIVTRAIYYSIGYMKQHASQGYATVILGLEMYPKCNMMYLGRCTTRPRSITRIVVLLPRYHVPSTRGYTDQKPPYTQNPLHIAV